MRSGIACTSASSGGSIQRPAWAGRNRFESLAAEASASGGKRAVVDLTRVRAMRQGRLPSLFRDKRWRGGQPAVA